jgi:hypothetical protein
MGRRVKEFIEIEDHASLDDLIAKLRAVRESLPPESEAEMRLRGDDVFGRKLCISYLREQTEEEAACEQRYSGTDAAQAAADNRPAARRYPPRQNGKLRIVA